MILKGQNLRILVFDAVSGKFKCIGLATSCTTNQTVSTENAATKDDVGLAAKPTPTSQGCSVNVESLDVSDVGLMLSAIKSMTQFTLMWDETNTSDNQEPYSAAFQRIGKAFLSDGTFTFDNRTNSAKSLQFTGTGPLEHDDQIHPELISIGEYTKGQYVRLFLSSNNASTPTDVIAAAQSLSLHVSLTMENATTKDTVQDWEVQEPTELNYDISTGALVRGSDVITSSVPGKSYADLMDIKEAALPVKWQIANVEGLNNRTKGPIIVSGSCIITNLQATAAVRQNATYQATLTGYGAYTVGA